MTYELDVAILLRVLAAAVLCGAVGYERETARKSAGLRTHMLVGMAAALFVGLGDIAVTRFPVQAHVQSDPIRVIQAVAIGIGFLGGGIIFVDTSRRRAVGLTTAASVWFTSAIGIAAGMGAYLLAAGSAVLAWIVLRALVGLDASDEEEAGDEEVAREK